MPDNVKLSAFRKGLKNSDWLWIKVCGITSPEDAQNAALSGADAIGFVFWKKSVRYISPQRARRCCDAVKGSSLVSVGVFMKRPIEEILSIASIAGIDVIQCHWPLSGTDALELKKRDYGVITMWDSFWNFPEGVDALIADSSDAEGAGGTGRLCNWQRLKQIKTKLPLVLAGGLSPENVSMAIENVRPDGVDVSTGVAAKDRKRKDLGLMQAFIESARLTHARVQEEV